MKNTKKSELRLKAEKILGEKDIKNSSFSKEKVETLIEELNIYQIELEHQNDELKKTQIELENTNAQYTDLYHQAPVGYFSVDQNKKIVNVNQKGADLFGQNINSLLNTQFTQYIHPDSQDIYYHHHRKVLKEHKPDFCEIKMATKSDNPIYFRLESIPTQVSKTNEMAIRTAIIDITSEKKLEEENYRRLHILENISDSVIVTDLNGEITYWNQGAERIFGYSTKEMLGKNPSVLYPHMNQAKLDYDLEKIKNGEDYIGEWKGRNKNGETVWVNIRTSALFDKQNKLVGYLGVAKDITELKQIELYKSQLASIVEYSEDGIESMDIDGNILSWNQGAEKIYGYKASEILGKNARKLYTDELKNELRQNLQEVREGKPVSNLITKRKRKNGDIIDVAITFSPIKNTDDHLIGVSVVTRDITEQTKVRNKLKESELRYQTIFEESGNAILVMSKDKIISCNKTLATLFGYTKDEIMGKSPIYFSPEYQFEDTTSKNLGSKYIKEAYEKGYVSFEWKHMNKKGDIIYTHISLKKIKIDEKNYLISILHDLTEIRNYQLKLKERNEEILSQNEEYRSLNEELHIKNEQLELSEEKFRIAFETSPDAIAINRLSDGLYINTNIGFTRLTAHTESDVKNKTSAEINIWVNPEDRQLLLKELEENGYVTNLEAQFKRKDGVLLSGLMSATIIEINNEKCILSITRDITEKKTAEEQIKELNFKTNLATESAQIGIWDFDLVNNKIIWDDNMYKLYGLNPDEFGECYEAWQNGLHPEDRERAFQESEDAIRGRKDFHTSFRVLWPDKTVRYIQAHAKVIRDKTGKAVRMTGVNWDITERISALKQVEEKEKRQRSVLKVIQTNVSNTQEFLDLALSEAISLTESKIGYIYYYDEDKKQFILNSWSKDVMKECLVMNPQTCYELDNTGIWGEAVRQRRAIMINDFKKENNLKKGYPKGHVELSRFLTVPIFYENKIVAVVGVANKQSNYNQADQIQLNLLMDSVWKSVNTKKAQNELIDSEEKYRLLFENMTQGFGLHEMVYDKKGKAYDYKYVSVNPAFEQLTGLKSGNILGKTVLEILPKTEKYWIKTFANVVETGKSIKYENYSKELDRYFEVYAYKSQEGYFATIINDITDRVKSKIDLENSRKRNEAILNAHPDFMFIFSEKGTILDYKAEKIQDLYLKPEEFLGKNVKEVLPEPIAALTFERMNQVKETGKLSEYSYDLEIKGKSHFFESRLVPYDSDMYLAVVRNITKRKLAEIEIENQKRLFESMFNTIDEGIVITDTKRNILLANQGMKKTFGYLPEQLIGKNTEMLYDEKEEYNIAGKKLYNKDADSNEIRYLSYYRDQKNRKFHGETFGTKLYDNEGKWIGNIGIIRDVSERMQFIEDLKNAKEKAEESDQLKSAFLANMSHEIRTPMNAIRGFSQLMVEVDFPKEKQKKFLEIINTRTQDLLVIIDDIIDISKIEANQLNIVEEEFSLNGMLTEIYNDKKPDFRTNVDLEFKLDLDSEPNKTSIFADKGRLKQVFINLINNAKKFTSEGSISFGYKINKSNELVFYVKDTGIGIPKDAQKLIFERFRQVDGSSTRKYGGTGLGLSICKQILSLMEGDIWVESEQGKGSIFYFSIPYKPAKKENNKFIKSETYEWSNKNVLIVEDDDVNLYYLRELLESTKVKIYKAHDRNETMEHLQNNKEIDLILLDINLPEVDGNEVVKEIRQTNKDIPVIAQSAYSMEKEIKESMKYGFNDYVTKPIDSKLLFSVMNKYLSKRKK